MRIDLHTQSTFSSGLHAHRGDRGSVESGLDIVALTTTRSRACPRRPRRPNRLGTRLVPASSSRAVGTAVERRTRCTCSGTPRPGPARLVAEMARVRYAPCSGERTWNSCGRRIDGTCRGQVREGDALAVPPAQAISGRAGRTVASVRPIVPRRTLAPSHGGHRVSGIWGGLALLRTPCIPFFAHPRARAAAGSSRRAHRRMAGGGLAVLGDHDDHSRPNASRSARSPTVDLVAPLGDSR